MVVSAQSTKVGYADMSLRTQVKYAIIVGGENTEFARCTGKLIKNKQ